jgi:hypothetical protein
LFGGSPCSSCWMPERTKRRSSNIVSLPYRLIQSTNWISIAKIPKYLDVISGRNLNFPRLFTLLSLFIRKIYRDKRVTSSALSNFSIISNCIKDVSSLYSVTYMHFH